MKKHRVLSSIAALFMALVLTTTTSLSAVELADPGSPLSLHAAVETVTGAQTPADTAQAPAEAPAETPEAPEETPAETAQAPAEAPAETPEAPEETPAETAQAPAEAPAETPEAPEETPAETVQAPAEAPAETPEAPEETPAETAQAPAEAPAETPAEAGEAPSEYPAFHESAEAGGFLVTLDAPEGVFPEGASLRVRTVSGSQQEKVDAAIGELRSEEKSVAASYTFDIKVLDRNGREIQPKDNSRVKVSFGLKEAGNANLDATVYHTDHDLRPEELDVIETAEELVVETDSFSYYTVEFTYNSKQYVLEGDTCVRLQDILACVGLTGDVTDWEVSNPELFTVIRGDEDGIAYDYHYEDEMEIAVPADSEGGDVLYMAALQMFDTQEWLDVVIDGIVYRITVTDSARVNGGGTVINDDRVIQGGTEDNFTADMPLATIWINEDIINTDSYKLQKAITYTQEEYDAYVSAHDGETPSWKVGDINYDDPRNTGRIVASYVYTGTRTGMNVVTELAEGQNTDDYGQLYFDFSKGSLSYGSSLTDDVWTGPVVEYRFINAGERFDPETQQYVKYDVIITYSDIHISLQGGSDPRNNLLPTYYNALTKYEILDTNEIQPKLYSTSNRSTNDRTGLKLDINVQVVDRDDNLVEGSYYFPFVDADVARTASNNYSGFAKLYQATTSENNYYSEQVVLLDNFGRPTSSGSWEQRIWIPGGAYDSSRGASQVRNMPYISNIDTVGGNLRIKPGASYGSIARDGYERPTPDSGGNTDGRNEDIYSGFATLANNTAGGIKFRYWGTSANGARPGGSGTVTSYVLAGSTRINHKLDTSSDVGGTVYTTTTGNSDGTLSGGELMGNGLINTPYEISAATGQNVTYTLTPNGGYKIKNVYVKNGDIDILAIVTGAKDSVDRSTFDSDGDGTLDETEEAAYEAALDAAVTNALNAEEGARRVPISELTDKGHGTYAYTFRGIKEDNSLHVEWEKTQLTVTKNIEPEEQTDHKFRFQIRLWDTSTQETIWRVRARKFNGIFEKNNDLEEETPYYMSYYESHHEEGEIVYHLPISPYDMTGEENPSEEGWYVSERVSLSGGGSYTRYIPAEDTEIDPEKTYYRRLVEQGNILRYYHHVLGYNSETGRWEDHVIRSDTPHEDAADLGLFDLNEGLPDSYRFVQEGEYVYCTDSFDTELNQYARYLMWVYDDALDEDVLVAGNTEMYPEGRIFEPGGTDNDYVYIWEDGEGLEDYSGKVIRSAVNISLNGQSHYPNDAANKYRYEINQNSAVYYDFVNNPDGYQLKDGYARLEGESGIYIITLPAGETPDDSALEADGWKVSESKVSATGDVFDMDAAFVEKGAVPAAGANTYEFTLAPGETIDFEGCVPMGWNYEIREVGLEGTIWELKRNTPNASIADYNGEEDVVFVNQKKLYDLTIEKQTVDDAPGTFTFTMNIYREEVIQGVDHTVTITASILDGAAGYVLNNAGAALEIPQVATIPAGEYVYGSGDEALDALIGTLLFNAHNAEVYTFTVDDETWEVATPAERPLGVEVTEMVDEGYTSAYFEPVTYTFSTEPVIIRHPYEPEVLPAGVTGSDGVYTFTLTNGSSIVFEDLLYGCKYEIVEDEQENWTLIDSSNASGMMNKPITAGFTNEVKTSLTVEKEADFNTGEDFAFRIRLWKTVGEETVSYDFSALTVFAPVPGADGVYAFTLKAGDSVTIPDISYGYQYEVWEADQDQNRVDPDSEFKVTQDAGAVWKLVSASHSDGTLETEDVTSVFRNEIKRGKLEVDKIVERGGKDETFRFRVKFTGPAQTEPDTPDPDGGAQGEDPAPGTSGQEQGGEDSGPAYANTLGLDLTGAGASLVADDTWEFTITTANREGAKVFENLPYGIGFEVWEVDAQGSRIYVGGSPKDRWELTGATGTSGIIGSDDPEEKLTAAFTNRMYVDLEVGKEVRGNMGDRQTFFKFRIRLENLIGGMMLTLDSSGAVKAFDGKTAEDLPNVSTRYSCGTILAANNRDDIPSLVFGTASAEVRQNHTWAKGGDQYQYDGAGGWVHISADGMMESISEEDIPDDAVCGMPGQQIAVLPDGTAEITVYLQHGQKASIRNIPAGAVYTVTEEDGGRDGYTANASLKSGDGYDRMTGDAEAAGTAITLDESSCSVADSFLQGNASVTFTNTRNGAVPTEIFFSWWSWAVLLGAAAVFCLVRRRIVKR